ncbi:DUF1254 domain-containing protein [Bdellovibrio sp. HCB337]|uniref:DUF1254 domain-containing protein n=1 Tax=Bdellovibrio sp. HCB337 TaxID=3394358 RepID=UPI0039A66B8F
MRAWGKKILAPLAFAVVAIGMSCTSKPKVAKNPEDIRQISKDAYIYGFPLVVMDATRGSATAVSKPMVMNGNPKAPANQFAHFRSFPDDTFKDIVTPNADTLYSLAWLDLSSGPQVLVLPDSGDRYYLAPMLDAWTNVFYSPGTRTTGNKEQTYVIAGPGWAGDIPEKTELVKAPTNTVWVMVRTNTKGPSDYQNVHAFQDKIRLQPLSTWASTSRYRAPEATVDTTYDASVSPAKQALAMSGEEFYTRLAELMKKNPPAAADGDALRNFARIGLIPGKSFDPKLLSEEGRQALNEGVKDAQADLVEEMKKPTMATTVDGWSYSRNIGSYGTNYKQRAFVALFGLGANLDADAIYPHAVSDANGEPLNGKNNYVIRFTKEKLPPTKGFWSLTMYNEDQAFVKNPLNRFTIGDRHTLKYNKDGSLDLYVQNKSPGKAKESNWLPAPKENFTLVMRLYWPGESVLNNTWRMPPIQKVSPAPRLGRTASLTEEVQ